MKQVLFLCTGNSARSLIAEGILRHYGKDQYLAVSAGSQPTGQPNPGAITILQEKGIDTSFARSKSWDEFAAPYEGSIDIIITVCSNAAGETCPIWPGHPVTAHWGVDDPASVTAPPVAVAAAFAKTYDEMYRRIMAFLALDTTKDQRQWLSELQDIGKIDDQSAAPEIHGGETNASHS